ncbi:MAG TPA: hypothetical protein VFU02_09170 [Polyangiaceae bacterium]|nr:hypothetical protein [Polyangiaceae bacterium]
MKHQKDHGQTLRDLVESALEQSLSRGETGRVVHGSLTGGSPSEPSAASPSDPGQRGGVAVGEVLDTHHPHLPGRVLVRWLELDGKEVERWLQRERHLSLLKGDRVLVTLPVGWNQWIVTGALGREAREPAVDVENARELRLGPGETLRVLSHEGQPLLSLTQGIDGPVLQLGDGNVELKVARTLRIKADTVELAAGEGGIDLRTDGDSVMRARTIRLN